MRASRLVLLLALASAPAAVRAQGTPVPRDPKLPYESWGAAARETAEAIAGRTLVKPADGRYQVGDAVIVDDDGKRYRAHVITVQPDRYEIHYDGQSASWKSYASPAEVLGYQPGYVPPKRSAAEAAAAAPKSSAPATPIEPGKWGCTESYWRITKGTYEFEMRGSFTMRPNGTYEYTGMRSAGRWRWDAAQSAVVFTGGFFDGARAVRLEGSPRIRLELPTNDPERPRKWACGRTDAP
jgi:uncharacterized cupin superfamily protein